MRTIDNTTKEKFTEAFRQIQEIAYANALVGGWWEEDDNDGSNPKIATVLHRALTGEKIALIHSEISEAIEGLRHGNPPDDKIGHYSSVEAEFADAIIRIMDLSARRGWDVAGAIIDKMNYNTTRPYKHGKKF